MQCRDSIGSRQCSARGGNEQSREQNNWPSCANEVSAEGAAHHDRGAGHGLDVSSQVEAVSTAIPGEIMVCISGCANLFLTFGKASMSTST
jgi:hypothetical protein